jgi:UDP-N-acetyl-D-glucosamine dehydrogenase
MSYHAVNKVGQALNDAGKSLNGSNILVVGVAFKPDVDDARNSPAQPIIEMLVANGATVNYHDPCIPGARFGGSRHLRDHIDLSSVELTADVLSTVDCVVIVTNHTGLDIDHIVAHAAIVVDTVNATAGSAGRSTIVRLGAPGDAQGSARA